MGYLTRQYILHALYYKQLCIQWVRIISKHDFCVNKFSFRAQMHAIFNTFLSCNMYHGHRDNFLEATSINTYYRDTNNNIKHIHSSSLFASYTECNYAFRSSHCVICFSAVEQHVTNASNSYATAKNDGSDDGSGLCCKLPRHSIHLSSCGCFFMERCSLTRIKSHYRVKMIKRPSYLHKVTPFTPKTYLCQSGPIW